MIILDHKVKIITHLMTEHHNWIEDSTVKDQMKAAKEVVQQALKPNQVPGGSREQNQGCKIHPQVTSINIILALGVAYAFPDSKGFGGNTTTAQLARKVFHSEELRGRMVNLCPEIYKQAMSRILFNDVILLRLMSCDYLPLPAKIGSIFALILVIWLNFSLLTSH